MSCHQHYYQLCATGKGLNTHWVPVEFSSGKGAGENEVLMTAKFPGAREKNHKGMEASMALTAAEGTIHESQRPLQGAAA